MTSFSSRLAAVVGQIAGVRLAELDESRAMAHLGEQLAEANLGLARVADPTTFSWAGYWLAVAETANGERAPLLMFGVPSAPVSAPDAATLETGRIVEGYLIAPLDLERPYGAEAYHGTPGTGIVTALFTDAGDRLLTAASQYRGAGRVLWLWDVANGKTVDRPDGRTAESVWCAAFAADGTFAVTAGSSGVLRFWKLR